MHMLEYKLYNKLFVVYLPSPKLDYNLQQSNNWHTGDGNEINYLIDY